MPAIQPKEEMQMSSSPMPLSEGYAYKRWAESLMETGTKPATIAGYLGLDEAQIWEGPLPADWRYRLARRRGSELAELAEALERRKGT